MTREGIEPNQRLSSVELARHAAETAYSKKGEEIVILDLREFSVGCDYFVLVSCKSTPHIRAVQDSVYRTLRTQWKEKPWHTEGVGSGRWVLLDYVNVVVHIFHEEARGFYMIERLWGDAPRTRISNVSVVSEAESTDIDSTD